MYFNQVQSLLKQNIAFVSITLVDSFGSTPQQQGSKILVTQKGHHWGTIGGGAIEDKAIKTALSFLEKSNISFNKNNNTNQLITFDLSKDVKMVCGGKVSLFFEIFNTSNWQITIFGAGHVAQALIEIIKNWQCKITCIDSRKEWLNKITINDNIQTLQIDHITDEFIQEKISNNSFAVVMTMGHKLDTQIVASLLKNKNLPYIGVIGSKSKRKTLDKDLLTLNEKNINQEKIAKIFCPIGLKIGSKDPAEIAVSIAAQLLQERDKLIK